MNTGDQDNTTRGEAADYLELVYKRCERLRHECLQYQRICGTDSSFPDKNDKIIHDILERIRCIFIERFGENEISEDTEDNEQ